MRAMNLANSLCADGHEVVLWSSAFYHQKKSHRSRKFETISISSKLRIELIPSPGYGKNVGISRLVDHLVLALNLSSRLRQVPLSEHPDVVFVGYPPIEAAALLLRWTRRHGIPSMLDVKDQWPSLFVEAFPDNLRPVAKLIFAPYFWLGRRAFRDATAYCSMSEPFLDWVYQFAGRARHRPGIVVPLSTPRTIISDEAIAAARLWWRDQGVDLSHSRRFAFVGSLSRMFDFSLIAQVARQFAAENRDCQIVLCGSGDEEQGIRATMRGLHNVIFPGWIDQPKIEALGASCSGMLAPYRNTDNFIRNFPNKIIDAFAMGCPVISSLDGEVRTWLDAKQVGFFSPDSASLRDALTYLLDNPSERLNMGSRSRAVYEKYFSVEKVYGGLVDALVDLACDR